jgi:secreted trypsin-like serine protease
LDGEEDKPYDGEVLPEAENLENYCGNEQTDGFIVGGEIAKQGAYPFIAAMGIENPQKPEEIIYVCEGSLINRRYVLTAAHCHSKEAPIVEVLLGEYDMSRDPDCSGPSCKSSN